MVKFISKTIARLGGRILTVLQINVHCYVSSPMESAGRHITASDYQVADGCSGTLQWGTECKFIVTEVRNPTSQMSKVPQIRSNRYPHTQLKGN